MVTIMCRLTVITVISLALLMDASAAVIRVTPDKNPVSQDESFQIHFDAEGSVDDDPDFSPLEDLVHILSTSQSKNLRIVNGQVTNSMRWSLTVLAKQPGTLTIPPISFGQDTSPLTVVEVSEQTQNPTTGQQTDNDIYLEATVSSASPYVQSEVIYKLKLFRAVAITRASLTDPEISGGDAVIEKIGEDRNYETSVNGRPYLVIERNYAVYPQASGTISIAPVSFMGQVPRNPYGMDPFGSQPRTVIRRSENITLDVQPIPDTFQGAHWLPAKNVTLAEEWSDDPLNIRVGEPITRTLILSAKGLSASQLPELADESIANLRFYPDRPALTNDRTAAGITATRREKSAIIPGQPGDYVLPEMTVAWWNTTTDEPEFAVLPERTIRVLAAPASNDQMDMTPSIQNPVESMRAPTGQEPLAELPQDTELSADTDSAIWQWISLFLLLVLLYSVFGRRFKSTGDQASKRKHAPEKETIKSLVNQITDYCSQRDPVKTRAAILRWSRLRWPESAPISLSEIARHTGPLLAAELHKLNNIVYGNQKEAWDPEGFLHAFKNEAIPSTNTDGGKNPPQGRLEPLYRI